MTTRPAPDAMTWVTALLPVADGVAVHAALDRCATAMANAGDPRTRGQLMADEFTRRMTETGCPDGALLLAGGSGVRTGSAPTVGRSHGPKRQIDLLLVMTDMPLFDGAETPAVRPGHGSIPAALARDMVAHADRDTQVWLRRLYADAGGRLATGDSRARRFPHAVRQFVLARDGRCRTPFCDAPIRDIDHDLPYSAGGASTLANARGLCRRCNLVKGASTHHTTGPPPRGTSARDRQGRLPGPPSGSTYRTTPSVRSAVPGIDP